MIYDKTIEIDLDKCRIISGLVDIGEPPEPSGTNIWMFREPEEIETKLTSYVIYQTEDVKYISAALPFSADFIRWQILEQKVAKIYINTADNSYFFDLSFLSL